MGRILSYGLTEIGLVRRKNEDAWAEIPDSSFYCLADGMGGHPAGDVAAKEAVDALCRICKQRIGEESWQESPFKAVERFLKEAIQEVNAVVYAVAASDSKLRGMGTTLCALHMQSDRAIYGHVGDSRIYRLRDRKLERLTQDHSLAHELLGLGQLKEDDLELFAHKNIITKSIGNDPVIEPTVGSSPLLKGDLYLLCTDGITDMLGLQEMEKILNRTSSIEEKGQDLVSAAMLKGGHDNATVVLVQAE